MNEEKRYVESAKRKERIASSMESRSEKEYTDVLNQGKISNIWKTAGDDWKNAAKYASNENNAQNYKTNAGEDYNRALKLAHNLKIERMIKYDKKEMGYTKEKKENLPNQIKNSLGKVAEEVIKAEKFMGLEKLLGHKKNFTFAILSVISLVFALFFVSSNITGYSILNINYNNLQWIGLCLFICGLTFAFLYFRKKGKF